MGCHQIAELSIWFSHSFSSSSFHREQQNQNGQIELVEDGWANASVFKHGYKEDGCSGRDGQSSTVRPKLSIDQIPSVHLLAAVKKCWKAPKPKTSKIKTDPSLKPLACSTIPYVRHVCVKNRPLDETTLHAPSSCTVGADRRPRMEKMT